MATGVGNPELAGRPMSALNWLTICCLAVVIGCAIGTIHYVREAKRYADQAVAARKRAEAAAGNRLGDR
jgi:hypothetical protein